MISKATIQLAATVLLLALTIPAQAQQLKKVPRVGVLFIGSRNQPHLQSFQQGLRDLGYVERKNIALEYRYAEGNPDRLGALAADLVRLPVDVIVTTTDQDARASSQATPTIPIVLITGDPVGSRLAATLAKPGGNVRGLTVLPSGFDREAVGAAQGDYP
jgi:putative tryptophan/tyrosine transport system substrate-binding protein